MNIKKIIKQIDEDLSVERQDRIKAAIKAAHPVIETLQIGRDSLCINGVWLKRIHVDCYNNFDANLPSQKFPIDILPVLRTILIGLFEKEKTYAHRAGIGLFIDYIKDYADELTVEEIQKMIDWDDADTKKFDEGFAEWLIGTSYCSDGNLSRYRPDLDPSAFKRKPLKNRR